MPGLTLPVSSTCAPSAKRRGFPKPCRRAISSAASTGNICARRASRVAEGGAFTLALLPYVFLYRVRIALVRLGRIAPVLAQRAPLPQEIPVAVELDLHLPEALLLLVAQLAVLEEAVLLGDQRFDVGENRCIFCGLGHGFSSVNLPSGGRPRTGTRRASRPRRSTPRAGSRSRRRRARRRPRAPRA